MPLMVHTSILQSWLIMITCLCCRQRLTKELPSVCWTNSHILRTPWYPDSSSDSHDLISIAWMHIIHTQGHNFITRLLSCCEHQVSMWLCQWECPSVSWHECGPQWPSTEMSTVPYHSWYRDSVQWWDGSPYLLGISLPALLGPNDLGVHKAGVAGKGVCNLTLEEGGREEQC